jgi:hypothetical protein
MGTVKWWMHGGVITEGRKIRLVLNDDQEIIPVNNNINPARPPDISGCSLAMFRLNSV